jgi:SAM-dependent methyltransferase
MKESYLSKVLPYVEIPNLGWAPDLNGVLCHQTLESTYGEVREYPEQMFKDDFSTSFWVTSRNAAILEVLRRLQIGALLEVGAGNGLVAKSIAAEGVAIVAVEPSYLGCKVLASSHIPVFNGTLDQLSLPSNTLTAVGLFDVLEHVQDTTSLLEEIYRVLAPGGYLVITVPAYQWLFGSFDINVGHVRRYTRKELSRSITSRGFVEFSSRYFFSLLVIPALLLRRVPYLIWGHRGKLSFSEIEEAMNPGKVLNSLLSRYFALEQKLQLPFGTSLLMVCQKPT